MLIHKKVYYTKTLNINTEKNEIEYFSLFNKETVFKNRVIDYDLDQSQVYLEQQFRQIKEIYNPRQIGYKGQIQPEINCGRYIFSDIEKLENTNNWRARFDFYSTQRMIPGACTEVENRILTSMQWIYCGQEKKLYIFKVQNKNWLDLTSIQYEFKCQD